MSLFISLEGGEGSGKTTQINKLAEFLRSEGHKPVTTREPGGTNEGEKIRELLVQKSGGNWTPKAELLLFNTARTMLVETIIKPALEEGRIVICDRFADSTRAYQGYGHGLDIELIENLNSLVLGDFEPDLTLYLDIDPAEGLKRSERRLAAEVMQVDSREDRYESLNLEFHQRLRDGFLDLAKKFPERIKVVNAQREPEKVFGDLKKIILKKLKEQGA